MKNILFLSFDFLREEDPNISLAIGSIISYLKAQKEYKNTYDIFHETIDMFGIENSTTTEDIIESLPYNHFRNFDFIAISAYVWNENYINELMSLLKEKYCFSGEFILGGYQISYSNNCILEYPNCKLFVDGYGEEAVYKILIGEHTEGIIKSTLNYDAIPSPYLSGVIPIQENQAKVRIETKRGCPYKCSFCAHRDLTHNKVLSKDVDKCIEELAFFKEKNVQKINILDPIFNAGKEYIAIMEAMVNMNLKALVSIQARFETIHSEQGERFLDLCQQLNIHLEFGLQTAIREESALIQRKNKPELIEKVMQRLNERNISYEVSLIYGLPSQTVHSFQESISFLKRNGCHDIKAFPLMLLKGTEIYEQKEKFGFVEKNVNEYNIPVVVSSNSFNEQEWMEMQAIAQSLELQPERV